MDLFKYTYYEIKRLLKKKNILFWTICFPVILGTLFYVSFGSIMEDNEIAKDIPIAVVKEKGSNDNFSTMLESLETDQENGIFKTKEVFDSSDESKAKKLLEDDEIYGYYKIEDKVTLVVKASGMQQTIMKQVLDEYERVYAVVEDSVKSNPLLMLDKDAIEKIAKEAAGDKEYTKEESFSGNSFDNMLGFFYALLAMTAIYGMMFGCEIVKEIEANISSLGMRRTVTPKGKLLLLASDFLGSFLIHYLEMIVVICYLKYILSVDFGNHMGYIFLSTAVGSMIGIAMGIFLAILIPGSMNKKEGCCLAVSMLLAFFSGLMDNGMIRTVELSAPWFNRINPCALLVQSYSSLHIYESMNEYFQNVLTMVGIAVLFTMLSVLMMRRKKYGSL